MIETGVVDGVANLTLNSGKVNALDLELVTKLNQSLDQLRDDAQIAGIIVAGNSRVFSAGIDLKRLVAEPPDYLEAFLPELTRLFVQALVFPKPLVIAITGHAVAGGCVLASAGDYRVISDMARIGVPELRVGVPFPTAGLEIMRWAATPGSFRKMINSGATFTGPHAVSAGLADQACPAAEVIPEAARALSEMRQVPLPVFALTKRQMRWPVVQAIDEAGQRFDSEIQQLWRAPETRRSIETYVARRL